MAKYVSFSDFYWDFSAIITNKNSYAYNMMYNNYQKLNNNFKRSLFIVFIILRV